MIVAAPYYLVEEIDTPVYIIWYLIGFLIYRMEQSKIF